MPDPLSPHEPSDSFRVDSGADSPLRSEDGDGRPGPAIDEPYAADRVASYEPVWIPVAAPRVRNRIWLHALLFAITILTTTFVGIGHWLAFIDDFGGGPLGVLSPAQLLDLHARYWYMGFWYSATILTILGAHELGHYFACRYYRIDASLPYFLPVPPPVETGTLGAFIRIRQPITTKRMLFDIGIAGPLAGFVFAAPALFLGVSLSHVARVPADFSGWELGEPLLFQLASHVVWGAVPAGYSLNLHPMAFAAWFGLLATALNLFPIGQLDGGHISYAVLKKQSTRLTYLTLTALVALNVVLAVSYGTPALLLFTVLIVVMLAVFGPRHPPVIDEALPLDRTRIVLAIVALAIFILCFTPVPIRVV